MRRLPLVVRHRRGPGGSGTRVDRSTVRPGSLRLCLCLCLCLCLRRQLLGGLRQGLRLLLMRLLHVLALLVRLLLLRYGGLVLRGLSRLALSRLGRLACLGRCRTLLRGQPGGGGLRESVALLLGCRARVPGFRLYGRGGGCGR
jgi:hypothetical protein